MQQDFIRHITQLIQEHLSEEQFGVSELAGVAGMSRSSLLRNIKSRTGLSASRFIRQIRLEKAMELLKEQELNVSEVAYACGFSSTSYFSKCFHEHYGHPPGEVGKTPEVLQAEQESPRNMIPLIPAIAAIGIVVLVLVLLLAHPFRKRDSSLEKSIAVLPFRNESPDTGNIYLINGIMESLLGDLQKIADLRVISRMSVEQFRTQARTVQEIGHELNANYLVTGSGQIQEGRILLNIQLIEAPGDRQLWSGRYLREFEDIFQLQMELARDISTEIEALVTPEEGTKLEKIATKNLAAYDLFLKGLEEFRKSNTEGLLHSMELFGDAIREDPQYADPHALMAIGYALIDIYSPETRFTAESRDYADRALLLDPFSDRSLVAKAMHHISVGEHKQSLPYLEKALEYNPNSAMAINALSDYYTHQEPDTEKYLEYALRGLQVDLASHDSTEAAIVLLHVANAFIQSAFLDEAGEYIDRSLAYDPGNLYTETLRAYLVYAQTKDLAECRDILRKAYDTDSSHSEILRELGSISYYMRHFRQAGAYYRKYFMTLENMGMEIPRGEFGKYCLILREMGQDEAAEEYLEAYLDYAVNDQSRYKHLSLSAYHALEGETESCLEEMELFSHEEKYPYWYVLFMEDEPIFGDLYGNPRFRDLLERIRQNFWSYHQDIRSSLEAKRLI